MVKSPFSGNGSSRPGDVVQEAACRRVGGLLFGQRQVHSFLAPERSSRRTTASNQSATRQPSSGRMSS